MQLNINEFTDNLVKFKSYRIAQAKTLWINHHDLFLLDGACWNYENFADKFAYANKNSGCFSDIEFDKHDKILFAERYGGVGIGGNGGGVRCGNMDDFQIKGTGINPVLGNHGNYNHSTGNYSLTESVTEVINSQIYSKILPIGTVKTYGLISIGVSQYVFDPFGYKLPLAIMVREACVRPAHFLRQPFFKHYEKYDAVIKKDTARVRAVNRALAKKFASHNSFVMYLGKFLANSANQFAFAKLFRIAHGAFSPSNVCFDGRWLDLTNMTMVPTGTNYAAEKDAVPFLAELLSPLSVVEQVLYGYGKYNYTDLNMAVLTKYYYEQIDSYFLHYIVKLFGIDPSEIENTVAVAERKILIKPVIRLIEANKQVSVAFPNIDNKMDSMQFWIETLFISLTKTSEHAAPLNICEKDIDAFKSLFFSSYQSQDNSDLSFSGYVSSALIKSLRKLYYAPFFYLGRIKNNIDEFLSVADQDELANHIHSYSDGASWIFDHKDTPTSIVIFSSENISITYNSVENSYELKIKYEEYNTICAGTDVLTKINLHDEDQFMVGGYCFKAGLIRMMEMLGTMEKLEVSTTIANGSVASPCDMASV